MSRTIDRGGEMSARPFRRSLEWDDLSDVTTGGSGVRRSVLVFVTSDGKRRRLQAGLFTPNGTALQDLVRFYWANPSFRNELTNGGADARLRERLTRV